MPKQLTGTGVVTIMRAPSADQITRAAEALVDSGIRRIEVTRPVPGALNAFATLAAIMPGDVEVGAGTVTTACEAATAAEHGATFFVGPAGSLDVLRFVKASGIPCYPGALTPTGVLAAWPSGASAVKLFPAATGCPRYLRRVRQPFPGIPLVRTGGLPWMTWRPTSRWERSASAPRCSETHWKPATYRCCGSGRAVLDVVGTGRQYHRDCSLAAATAPKRPGLPRERSSA